MEGEEFEGGDFVRFKEVMDICARIGFTHKTGTLRIERPRAVDVFRFF